MSGFGERVRRATRGLAIMGSALALAVATACTSPTLPLPPPTLPTVLQGPEPGSYHLVSTNGAQPNALVIAVNRNESLPANDRVTGTLADAQGSWELFVKGSPGDILDLSQQSGELRSPTTDVMLR